MQVTEEPILHYISPFFQVYFKVFYQLNLSTFLWCTLSIHCVTLIRPVSNTAFLHYIIHSVYSSIKFQSDSNQRNHNMVVLDSLESASRAINRSFTKPREGYHSRECTRNFVNLRYLEIMKVFSLPLLTLPPRKKVLL